MRTTWRIVHVRQDRLPAEMRWQLVRVDTAQPGCACARKTKGEVVAWATAHGFEIAK